MSTCLLTSILSIKQHQTRYLANRARDKWALWQATLDLTRKLVQSLKPEPKSTPNPNSNFKVYLAAKYSIERKRYHHTYS